MQKSYERYKTQFVIVQCACIECILQSLKDELCDIRMEPERDRSISFFHYLILLGCGCQI